VKQLYKRKTLLELKEKRATIEPRYRDLLSKWSSHDFKNEIAPEYARYGFLRRVKTLRQCIDNTFRLISPAARKVPSERRLSDAAINIQAFFANAYGAIDNLAWVWVYERGLFGIIPKSRVGFRGHHTELRATLSQELQDYVVSRDGWLKYVIDYRDALAHRIPLYIPPGTVPPKDQDAYRELEKRRVHALYVREDTAAYQSISAKQSKLLVFKPIITHSLRETSGFYPFHWQMVVDFLTVEEFGHKMFEELKQA
jgi:hypothetical protein